MGLVMTPVIGREMTEEQQVLLPKLKQAYDLALEMGDAVTAAKVAEQINLLTGSSGSSEPLLDHIPDEVRQGASDLWDKGKAAAGDLWDQLEGVSGAYASSPEWLEDAAETGEIDPYAVGKGIRGFGKSAYEGGKNVGGWALGLGSDLNPMNWFDPVEAYDFMEGIAETPEAQEVLAGLMGDKRPSEEDPWAVEWSSSMYDDVIPSTSRGIPDQSSEQDDAFNMARRAQPPAAAGIDGTLSTHGIEDTGPDDMDIRTDTAESTALADTVNDLQAGDRDAGGDGVKKGKYRETGFAPGARGKFLSWLGHDEESGSRLGNSLMAAGGAILSSRSPHWSQALGEGITAGTNAYQDEKQATLDDEVERARLQIAQEELNLRRKTTREGEVDKARERAWAVAEKQREGWVVDDQGRPVKFSPSKARKYASPMDEYAALLKSKDFQIASWLTENDPDNPGDPRVLLDLIRRKYLGEDPLAGLGQ